MRDRTDIDRMKADRAAMLAALQDAGAVVNGDQVRCPFHDDHNPSGGVHKHEGAWLYTCQRCTWNAKSRSGDVFAVVQRMHGCDFKSACERLGVGRNGNGLASTTGTGAGGGSSGPDERKTLPTPDDTRKSAADAQSAHTRLMADSGALDHLWRTRAIDRATAERFRLGITGESGRRFWTLPVTRGNAFYAIKGHAAEGQRDKKCWWQPTGGESSHLWPVALQPDGPVWICPGELKALAVIGAGCAAVGITSGETVGLPDRAFDLLRGRDVAIPPDDDTAGRKWGERVREQLTQAGINARIVDVGFDTKGGVNDIGDWVTRRLVEDGREPTAVAATLADHWRRSDPWLGCRISELWSSGRMWQPVTFVSTGLAALDSELGGGLRTRAVSLFVGKAGHAKTQLGITCAVNAAKCGTATAFFSLELGADEVAQVAAAQLGGIPRRSLAMGQVTGENGDRLRDVRHRYSAMPLTVLDDERWPGGLDRDGFAELVAEGVERFGWRFVVLDYLGLLRSLDSDRTDYTSDLLNSSALRRIARRNDIALVVIAALRKSGTFKKIGDNIVTLDDVAGAGRLVYDATNVLLVSAERGDADYGIVHVRPLKLRFAPLVEGADVQLRWRPKTGLIENL